MAMLPAQAPSEQGPVHHTRPRLAGSPLRGLAGRSDERLVAIAKEGDERAFEILYERHSPAILRYCRSLLRSTQEAEDVKQETFVLAISAVRRGAEPDTFRPWLYRVAHNACMSHLRVRRPVLVADNGVLVGPATAAPVDDHREELRQLLDDIGKLPDVQRGALLLREMDGFSYEQVGEVLGLPLSTVRASIFRARRTLQGLAEARDADCEAIQSELSRLADRRGRRGRHITTHLNVCSNCRDFRDGLRRRPAVLGGVTPAVPFGPGGLFLALKGKLLGGAAAGGGTGAAIATGGGGAGVAKIAAVAASSIALLAGAGVEADHVIDHGRRDAGATPHRAAPAATGAAPRAAAVPAAGPPAADLALREGRLEGTSSRAFTPAPRPRVHARAKTESGLAAATADTTTTTDTPAPAAAIRTGGTSAPVAGEHEHAGTGHPEDGSATHQRSHRHRRPAGDEAHETSGGSGGTGSGHGGTERVEHPPERPASGSGSSGSGPSGSGSGSGGSGSSGTGQAPSAPDDTPTATVPAPAPAAPAPADPAPDSGNGPSGAPTVITPPGPAPPDDPDTTALPPAEAAPGATTAADTPAPAAAATAAAVASQP